MKLLRKARALIQNISAPHIVHLCMHCNKAVAGFWVYAGECRRPWCLNCIQESVIPVDRVVSFEGYRI